MIDIDDLKPGEWYDGFVWYKAKQQRAATLCWHTSEKWDLGYFFSGLDETNYGLHCFTTSTRSFEPLTISKEEVSES